MSEVLDAVLAVVRNALASVTVEQQPIPLVEGEPESFPFLTLSEGGITSSPLDGEHQVAFTVRAVTRDATMRQSQAVLNAALAAVKELSVEGYTVDRVRPTAPDVRVSRDNRSRSLAVRVSARVRPKRKR